MAKLKLNSITDGKDKNRYCGPSAISALTDLTTGEAARLIRMIRGGARKITGTSTSEVQRALRACNISMRSGGYTGLNRKTGPTLAAWLKLSKADRTPGRIFLIVAGWHWQLVSGRRYTCGRVREIVSIKDKRVKRRARVAEVYELTSDNVTRPRIDVTKPKPPKDPNASDRAKAQRIAKKIGASIEIEGRNTGYESAHYWISPPEGFFATEEEDPHEQHCYRYWDEVLAVMQDYEALVGGREMPSEAWRR
jgi:hypothetical protein